MEELSAVGKRSQAPVRAMCIANLVYNQFVLAVLSCHLLPSLHCAVGACSGSRGIPMQLPWCWCWRSCILPATPQDKAALLKKGDFGQVMPQEGNLSAGNPRWA